MNVNIFPRLSNVSFVFLALIAVGSCGRPYHYPKECLRREDVNSRFPVTILNVYTIDPALWRSETDTKGLATHAVSIQGVEADNLWREIEQGIESRRGRIETEGLPFKPQDYLVFATNSAGQKWSIKVGSTSKGSSEYYLNCRWAETVWTVGVSHETAKKLGVGW